MNLDSVCGPGVLGGWACQAQRLRQEVLVDGVTGANSYSSSSSSSHPVCHGLGPKLDRSGTVFRLLKSILPGAECGFTAANVTRGSDGPGAEVGTRLPGATPGVCGVIRLPGSVSLASLGGEIGVSGTPWLPPGFVLPGGGGGGLGGGARPPYWAGLPLTWLVLYGLCGLCTGYGVLW